MGHTPGPWEVRELLPDGAIIRHPGTYEIRTHGYDVATYIRAAGPFRKREDAELAAAAPDLLAALEPFAYLAEVLEEGQMLNFRGVYVSYEQAMAARDAIAKAKGENDGSCT